MIRQIFAKLDGEYHAMHPLNTFYTICGLNIEGNYAAGGSSFIDFADYVIVDDYEITCQHCAQIILDTKKQKISSKTLYQIKKERSADE